MSSLRSRATPKPSRPQGDGECHLPAEVRRAASLLERRWAIAVVYASQDGATRFADFSRVLGAVPPATLVTRLNELVEQGVLERRCQGRRVEYRLTQVGEELAAIVAALGRWSGARPRRTSVKVG